MYKLKNFFELLISKSIISLTKLNKRIVPFDYSISNGTKTPSPVFINDYTIGTNISVSQILCLIISLPGRTSNDANLIEEEEKKKNIFTINFARYR